MIIEYEHLKVLLPQENQGVSVARNNALKKVSGDYIYFFDADDYQASKISFIPEYLYHYRIDNPNSISNTRLKRFKDIFSIIQIVEDFLKDENLFEEFKEEFEYFKINRIIYEMKGRPNEYFLIAKDELSKVNHDNDLLSENVLFKFETIMNSNSIEEYNYKLEINNLKKKNEKFSKEIKKLKNQNRELKNKNNKLKKQNNEILNSKSWKLSEPFRKAKRILKK